MCAVAVIACQDHGAGLTLVIQSGIFAQQVLQPTHSVQV